MRLFVGIWLDSRLNSQIDQFISRSRQNCSGFKWTVPENLHFTLRFLGEVAATQVECLKNALRQVASTQSVFNIGLGKVGFFPNHNTPRVVWIGLTSGGERLVRLADAVETACMKSGFGKSGHPFQPHLTIARAHRNRVSIFGADTEVIFPCTAQVGSFSLIESKLTSVGPQYRSIGDFAFGNP